MRTPSRLVSGLTLILLACLVIGLVPAQVAGAQEPPASSRYIVVFQQDANVEEQVRQLTETYGVKAEFIYEHALLGVAAEIPDALIPAIENHPLVEYVVHDNQIYLNAQTVPTGVQRAFAAANPALGIDGRDDQRVDVDVAVLDTGIDREHPDLNVYQSVDCTNGWLQGFCGEGGDDDHFHGTHVAGIIGALDNGDGVVGVAPGARLWSVKSVDKHGVGLSSWLIAAIDYVAANAAEIDVANISIGCADCANRAQDEALANAVAVGVTFVVSAGNEGHDASRNSPANHPDVIAVSAIADFDGLPGGQGAPTCEDDQDDSFAWYSNFGAAVTLAAPGTCIFSTYPLEHGSVGTLSGSSMASPHVAGAAAVLAASGDYPPAKIREILTSTGNFDWTDDSGDGIQEPLLDMSNTSLFAPRMVPGTEPGEPAPPPGTPEPTPPADAPPAVTLTAPAEGSLVSGVVTITADASDDVSITQVEFLVDGTSIGVDTDGADGWSAQWDTTTVPDAAHLLTARATDTAGQTAESNAGVTVQNNIPDNPPTVHITSPGWGETVSGTVTITAEAGDDNGVVQVEFFANGASAGVDADGADGWSAQWDSTTLPDGAYTLAAAATDTAGQTMSSGVTVVVSNGVEPPIHLSGSVTVLYLWGRISLSWSGADAADVDVYRNGVNIGATPNDGDHVDWVLWNRAYEYQVCETGTRQCSNTVTLAPEPPAQQAQ